MKNIFLTILFSFFLLTLSAQTNLIDYGDSWLYYDLEDEPTIGWTMLGYNDNSWQSGDAPIGHGDPGIPTVVDSDVNAFYVRKEIFVTDPSVFGGLSFSLDYDDGAVVYLNGVEIHRQNMPEGIIEYETDAVENESGTAEFVLCNNLVQGNNIIAVEIHQRESNNNSSGDLFFDFRMIGLSGGTPAVIRGPYLQMPSPNAITVRWRTDTPTESYLYFGETSINYTAPVFEDNCTTEHELRITGLDPSTQYSYALGNENNILVPENETLYFTTSPETQSTGAFSAWILGDAGRGGQGQKAVRDAYYDEYGEHANMILFLGDNAYSTNTDQDDTDGEDEDYQGAFFDIYEKALVNSPAWSCIGNHEDGLNIAEETGPYFDIFTFPKEGESGGLESGVEAYYSFDYGNTHFICLDSQHSSDLSSDDSDGDGAIENMYEWCEADLQNVDPDIQWIVAFWHHPPYTKGSHDSDDNGDSGGRMAEMRENFLPLLEMYGVDLVLGGHSHVYERSHMIAGHYGTSGNFDGNLHYVNNGGESGKDDVDEAYCKILRGAEEVSEGTVYVVTGSAGRANEDEGLGHPIMFYDAEKLGSSILDINDNELTLRFLAEDSEDSENYSFFDYFTIRKSSECDDDTNPEDPCDRTITDNFDNASDPYGNWNEDDPGCFLSEDNAVSPPINVVLNDDNIDGSAIFSDEFNYQGVDAVNIDFTFITDNFISDDKLYLEVSTNGGSSFNIFHTWVIDTWAGGDEGENINDNQRYFPSICIDNVAFTDQTVFKFRSDAPNTTSGSKLIKHKVYIDDIAISCGDCGGGGEGDCVLINALDDDAEENYNTGKVDIISSKLDLGYKTVGLRFEMPTIPVGATIESAFIQFTSFEDLNDDGDVQLLIEGESTSNPIEYSDCPACSSISNRTYTNTSVPWSTGGWNPNDDGALQQSPDLSAIVQEILNGGNTTHLAFMITRTSGGGNVEAFTGGSGDRSPELCITFSNDCISVIKSSDDAEEKLPGQSLPGSVDVDDPGLGIGAGNIVGLRFETNIPPNATITSAFIQFTSISNELGTTQIIAGVNPDGTVVGTNSPTSTFEHCPTASCQDISNRPIFNTPTVLWGTDPWMANTDYDTDDISSIVSSIVNSQNYDGDMVFTFTEGDGVAFRVDAASADSKFDAPRLCVQFTTQGEGKGNIKNEDLQEIVSNKKPLTLSINPNPFQDQFDIQFDSELLQEGQVLIYTSDGSLLTTTTVATGQRSLIIDTKDWPNGLYFLMINNGDQQLIEKLIKQ